MDYKIKIRFKYKDNTKWFWVSKYSIVLDMASGKKVVSLAQTKHYSQAAIIKDLEKAKIIYSFLKNNEDFEIVQAISIDSSNYENIENSLSNLVSEFLIPKEEFYFPEKTPKKPESKIKSLFSRKKEEKSYEDEKVIETAIGSRGSSTKKIGFSDSDKTIETNSLILDQNLSHPSSNKEYEQIETEDQITKEYESAFSINKLEDEEISEIESSNNEEIIKEETFQDLYQEKVKNLDIIKMVEEAVENSIHDLKDKLDDKEQEIKELSQKLENYENGLKTLEKELELDEQKIESLQEELMNTKEEYLNEEFKHLEDINAELNFPKEEKQIENNQEIEEVQEIKNEEEDHIYKENEDFSKLDLQEQEIDKKLKQLDYENDSLENNSKFSLKDKDILTKKEYKRKKAQLKLEKKRIALAKAELKEQVKHTKKINRLGAKYKIENDSITQEINEQLYSEPISVSNNDDFIDLNKYVEANKNEPSFENLENIKFDKQDNKSILYEAISDEEDYQFTNNDVTEKNKHLFHKNKHAHKHQIKEFEEEAKEILNNENHYSNNKNKYSSQDLEDEFEINDENNIVEFENQELIQNNHKHHKHHKDHKINDKDIQEVKIIKEEFEFDLEDDSNHKEKKHKHHIFHHKKDKKNQDKTLEKKLKLLESDIEKIKRETNEKFKFKNDSSNMKSSNKKAQEEKYDEFINPNSDFRLEKETAKLEELEKIVKELKQQAKISINNSNSEVTKRERELQKKLKQIDRFEKEFDFETDQTIEFKNIREIKNHVKNLDNPTYRKNQIEEKEVKQVYKEKISKPSKEDKKTSNKQNIINIPSNIASKNFSTSQKNEIWKKFTNGANSFKDIFGRKVSKKDAVFVHIWPYELRGATIKENAMPMHPLSAKEKRDLLKGSNANYKFVIEENNINSSSKKALKGYKIGSISSTSKKNDLTDHIEWTIS